MHLHNQVNPTKEQFKALMQLPLDQPIVMLNILKYKQGGGKEAYQRYTQNVMPFLKKANGRLIWKGQSLHTVIGDTDDQPDLFMLVEYPSIVNFVDMITSPAYQVVAKDRTMSLIYGGLVACGSDYSLWEE
ncbi:MAG: DUF1330 domain-containing protein [Bacteroidota bacterium]